MVIASLCVTQIHAAEATPSSVFDLSHWKLTMPGPKEIKKLQNYSSGYFDLNADREMGFHLNAAEKGATPNAHYVRSELRHLPNWWPSESHSLSAEVRVVSHLKPDKVTVVQIHGITPEGGDVPPLLRIAVENGDLFAIIKTTDAGDVNDKTLLVKGLGEKFVQIDVAVKEDTMQIRINGEEKVKRSLAFWKHPNYFKAGCYPQATEGTVDVMFRRLTAE